MAIDKFCNIGDISKMYLKHLRTELKLKERTIETSNHRKAVSIL